MRREHDAAADTLAGAQDRVAQEEARLVNTESGLVDVLAAAKAYFVQHRDPEACPLCGSREYADGLAQRVEAQLATISSLTEAMASRSRADKALGTARTVVERQFRAYRTAADRLVQSILQDQLPGLAYPSLLVDAAHSYPPQSPQGQPVISMSLSEQVTSFLAEARLVQEDRRKRRDYAQTLRRAVDTYDANYLTRAELELLVPRLQTALAEMQAERRKFVDDVLKKVAGRVGDLYEEIHPGEGLSKISLALDPDRRASLDILGDFPETKDAPLGAYFSESHLDTLGLCIWLALAEMNDPKSTVLVLDDVVASVDEPHVERTVESLVYSCAGFRALHLHDALPALGRKVPVGLATNRGMPLPGVGTLGTQVGNPADQVRSTDRGVAGGIVRASTQPPVSLREFRRDARRHTRLSDLPV